MREILFKAKRKDNGEWVEGYYRADLDLDTHYICGWNYYASENGLEREPFEEEINPDTLCQYTGLTDKNGNKIWENDILKANLDESYPEDITYIKILWNECRFCVNENYSTDIWTLEKWDAEHFQVCGNIFDNPDLSEVK